MDESTLKLPMTPRVKKIIALSQKTALGVGHNYIGTEHLLMGILREGENAAVKQMVEAGVDVGALRQRVQAFLDGLPKQSPRNPNPPVGIIEKLRAIADEIEKAQP